MWHRTNAPKLVAMNEDLHKAIKNMESRELKRDAEEVAQHLRTAAKIFPK